VPCGQGGLYETEIDIARSWWYQFSPFYLLTNEIRDYHIGTDCVDNYEIKDRIFGAENYSYSTFKCIWTPSYVRCYLNDTLKFEVLNTGQEWFPEYSSYLSLFQALDTDVPLFIDVPQTTYVDYVSVKKFFATPEITINNISCLASTATMNVDPAATNISWQLTPSTLFTTLSGTGRIANIAKASGSNGMGKITYSFQMPSGETFTAEKDVWVGTPHDVNLIYEGGGGGIVGDYYPLWVSDFDYRYDHIVWGSTPAPADLIDLGYGNASIKFGSPGYYDLWAYNTNDCGSSAYAYVEDVLIYELLMSPNPASNEIQVTLSAGEADATKAATKMANTAYSVTITDLNGSVKSQKKYMGNKFTVPVQNLRNGNYLLQVSDGKIKSTKQFVVKH
jgi:hypothetical protein